MADRRNLVDDAGGPVIGRLPIIAVAGIVVLVLSEVLRQGGAALRAELDEVV